MLKVHSNEWKEFIEKLEVIKTKSNREVLCIHCWQMLNCKQKIKHLKKSPDHEKYLLTSTKYASEKQIISLAKAQNKFFSQGEGEYVITPYGPLNRQFREHINQLVKEDQNTLGNIQLINQQQFKPQNIQATPQQLNNGIQASSGLDQANVILKQNLLWQQMHTQLSDMSSNDKFAVINQKLDSIVKVLQMLVQQDLLVNQNLTHLNSNLQNLTQISIGNKMTSCQSTSDYSNSLQQIFQQPTQNPHLYFFQSSGKLGQVQSSATSPNQTNKLPQYISQLGGKLGGSQTNAESFKPVKAGQLSSPEDSLQQQQKVYEDISAVQGLQQFGLPFQPQNIQLANQIRQHTPMFKQFQQPQIVGGMQQLITLYQNSNQMEDQNLARNLQGSNLHLQTAQNIPSQHEINNLQVKIGDINNNQNLNSEKNLQDQQQVYLNYQ